MTADETSVHETAEIRETAKCTETADAGVGEDADGAPPARMKRIVAQVKKRSAGKILPTLVGLMVVASLALLGGLYYLSYRPDREIDAAAANAATSAARDGTVAVLSYSPDTLDRDISSAKSHLTGDFLTYYDQFTERIVAPAAKQKSVKTSAVVLRAALSEFHRNSATVLLFVNQKIQSKDRPEPTMTSSSVSVTLTKADGKWLISSFTPV